MAKRSLSVVGVTKAAMVLVDQNGLRALNLSAVAETLTVGPSALYTHVDGLAGLRHLVAIAATNELTTEVRNAAIGVAGRPALNAMSSAYRNYALRHPGLYQSTLMPPVSSGDELGQLNQELLNVFAIVYQSAGLDVPHAQRAARCTRTAIHGFVTLEITTGSSPQHDQHFRELLDTLAAGITGVNPTGDQIPPQKQ